MQSSRILRPKDIIKKKKLKNGWGRGRSQRQGKDGVDLLILSWGTNAQRRLRKQVRHREGFICLKATDPIAQGTLNNNEKDPIARLRLSYSHRDPLLSMLTPSEVNPVNMGRMKTCLWSSTEKDSLKGKKLRPQR